MTRQEVIDLIRKKAKAAGVDPTEALAHASIETGGTFDPNAGAGKKYQGLYQFGPAEWQQFGSGDPLDPHANIEAYLKARPVYAASFAKAAGLEPSQVTPQQMYLAWQQGPTGAARLLQNGAQPASSTIGTDAYNGNLPANVARTNLSGREFADFWSKKYDQHAGAVSGGASTAAPQAAASDYGFADQSGAYGGLGDNAAPTAADFGGGGFDWGKVAKLAPMVMGLANQSGGLLGGNGQPAPEQATPMLNTQAHKPDMNTEGLLNPFLAQLEKRRQMLSLLGAG